jgi:alpha,alpha-trehalose phosphorylase (configuration-retaining)
VLQAVSDPSVELSQQDKELYEHWSQENAQLLSGALQKATTIVIDDPQPAGLIPFIKEHNPKARLLYRSHIQIEAHLLEDKTTPQSKTWDYLWKYIQHADTFIAHPVASFVPSIVPREKLVSFPPTTDHLDGLNKPLTPQQLEYYLDLFNQILLQSYQSPLDTSRPYLIQIARFDPSKGIPDVIESYRLAREKLAQNQDITIPQLVIVGHGSIDDPDGMPLLHLTNHMLSLPLYRDMAHDVKVARVHHSDQLLNALLRQAHVALQLSHKEGFEIKVSEALLKGKPVLSYNAGGIPLQIEHAKNGFVIDQVGNTQAVAEKIVELFTNKKRYQEMSRQASELARRDVLTVPNAIRWLQLAVGEEVKV